MSGRRSRRRRRRRSPGRPNASYGLGTCCCSTPATTVGALAGRLSTWSGITVITSGLTSLNALADSEGVELIVLGGTVRHVSLGLIGPIAESTLRGVTADAVFLGADGVTADRGLCETTAEQAALKRLMVEQADEVYVLADASKIGRTSGHWWTALDRPWTLVTDAGATEEALAPFHARPEITVRIAPFPGADVGARTAERRRRPVVWETGRIGCRSGREAARPDRCLTGAGLPPRSATWSAPHPSVASARARNSSTVEAAPGSRWPTLRGPR